LRDVENFFYPVTIYNGEQSQESQIFEALIHVGSFQLT
jgi:hypothetical protein